MDVTTLFYHGIREQIRKVVLALGDERVDKGLTAFEDGRSDWNDCFFARALADDPAFQKNRSEDGVAEALNLRRADGGLNLIPVRIVYYTFDNHSTFQSRKQLYDFIVSIRDRTRDPEVMRLIRSINYEQVEDTPVALTCQTQS